MKRIFSVFVCSFFLTGCFLLYPSNKADFSDFIPIDSPEIKSSFNPKAEGDFAIKNFPESCEWVGFKRVVDGDTLVIENDIRIRLIGIDTPETKHPTKKIEPFGLEATKKSQEFLNDSKQVCLMTDSIGDTYDKYARRLGYVFAEDGTDINAKLVRLGLAKAYIRFDFIRKEEFLWLESLAKDEKIGIWSQ